MVNVLFVCLGNICRSPLAEGVFRNMLHESGLTTYITCDSAGTSSYHVGESPDYRMRQTSLSHGLTLRHQARQLVTSDFTKFDYILAMDKSNLEDILTLYGLPNQRQVRIKLMRDFDDRNDSLNVPDPYFGGTEGFEDVYSIVERSCRHFLAFLRKEHTFS